MILHIYCDNCKEETEHKILRKDKALYQCNICKGVVEFIPEKEIDVRAVISKASQSVVGKIRVSESEMLKKGDEIIVELDNEFRIGEITSLEIKNGKRVEIAKAKDVTTVWLRDVGEVIVKFSLHKGPITTPFTMNVSGETEFIVGERVKIEHRNYKISRIKTKDGKLLKKNGQKAKAKEIKRVYAIFER